MAGTALPLLLAATWPPPGSARIGSIQTGRTGSVLGAARRVGIPARGAAAAPTAGALPAPLPLPVRPAAGGLPPPAPTAAAPQAAVQARPQAAPNPIGPWRSQVPATADLYVLGPGDGLQLSFLDPSARDVGGPVLILPDGTSTLALLGSVQLTGLSLSQASRWLTSLYSRHLVRPQLILSLIRPRPVQVSVLGEVHRPGLYSFASARGAGEPGAAAGGVNLPITGLITPVSAIQAAGGITLDADIRRVILRRPAAAAGSERQIGLDLADLLQSGNQRQNPILFDGDTLVIGRAERPLPREVIEIGASNLSPALISVTVLGEVKLPGTLALPANTPLQEALTRAGGPTDWRADRGQIELVRLNRDGTATREFYSYRPGQNISAGFNPPLRDRDTLIVRRSAYGQALDLLNQLVVPLVQLTNTLYFYNSWGRNN
ncbi:MAG: SLBB domain-containing protein [Synechococcus sp.]|nr:SLBB domain-containing protein [Synechococcus sp.]